ncbi:MAG: hypothetical protein K2H20_04785, partial [Bacilli bacterium]|nr:hypothetical protein [Bacilli bacterium]
MSEETKNNIVSHIEGTRLYFVDPSKVNGLDEKSGVEFTPPYEDMCIAFTLEIETYSRFDEDEINRTGIAGTSKEKKFSLLEGELKTKDGTLWEGDIDECDNNYLTTYYTEISSDGYKEKEKVEGLGVESIQVNYDNYYMPTIVIKFIDVRGSALFGREEAIHTDKSGTGKINASNIFGAFFTIPYPKFKLQIKGFYGQAVTYQLTCSGFEASFNAKTGNVEAVAKFIGYNWALLTDVPFSYLVAAPYCSYIGKKYWDTNKVKDKWKMINSPESGCTEESPTTLYDLHQQIESCTVNAENTGSGATENSMNSDLSSRSEILGNLTNAINNFINSVNNKSVVTSDEIKGDEPKNYFNDILNYIEAYQSNEEGFAQEILNNTEYDKGLKEIKSETIDENNITYV